MRPLSRPARSLSLQVMAVALAATSITAGATEPRDASLPTGRGVAVQAPGSQSVTALGDALLAAFGESSFEPFAPRIATADDFREIFQRMVEVGEITEEQMQGALSDIGDMEKATLDSVRNDFALMLEKAQRLEVDWDGVTLRYEVETYGPAGPDGSVLDAAGADAAEPMGGAVTIYFDVAGEPQRISFGDCARTSRGWIVMERMRWLQS